MLKVKNKLNTINYVCGVELKPFGVKDIDVEIGNEEIQEKVRCNSIVVVEVYNEVEKSNNADNQRQDERQNIDENSEILEIFDVVKTENVKSTDEKKTTRRKRNKN